MALLAETGTFAPPAKFCLLQRLLQFNFGTEIPIVTLDRQDPRLIEYSEANNID